MVNIIDIYNSYLLDISVKENKRRQKNQDKFSASSAGYCFRKQWYKVNGYEQIDMDERSLRLLRLGTIVHRDLEKAVNRFVEFPMLYKQYSPSSKAYTEHKVTIPELNVVGHLDVAVIDGDEVQIYDLKTAHSFKWKKVFGRNVDPNPSVNYQLQLGTYGLGMLEKLKDEEKDYHVKLNLIWYKKDDSMMKVQPIADTWIDDAFEYWAELNEEVEVNGEPPEIGTHNVPIYNWECKYCPYHKIHCKGI